MDINNAVLECKYTTDHTRMYRPSGDLSTISASTGSNFAFELPHNSFTANKKSTSESIAIPIPKHAKTRRRREGLKKKLANSTSNKPIPIANQRKMNCSENASQATEYESMEGRQENRQPDKLTVFKSIIGARIKLPIPIQSFIQYTTINLYP